jgi:hypothetical protein
VHFGVASDQQVVQVNAVSSLQQAEDSSVGQTIGTAMINDLPLNRRNWLSLGQLAGGCDAQHKRSGRRIALGRVAVSRALPGYRRPWICRVWKAWKATKPVSHPSHTLKKSFRDPPFPRPRNLIYIYLFRAHSKQTIYTVSGL